jgi:hypothetical protein
MRAVCWAAARLTVDDAGVRVMQVVPCSQQRTMMEGGFAGQEACLAHAVGACFSGSSTALGWLLLHTPRTTLLSLFSATLRVPSCAAVIRTGMKHRKVRLANNDSGSFR